MTGHATQRSLSRGVVIADIEKVINFPEETIYDDYEETYKSYGRIIDPYTKQSRYLIIVHTGFNKHVKVITLMWVNSKGGLKAHGFSSNI